MKELGSILKGAALAALALLGPATLAQQQLPTVQPMATVPAPIQARPALWKLADKDTTIYLFGTIHILPKGLDWFNGPLAYAFNHSDLLVTELPETSTGKILAAMGKHGVLPAGQNLRHKLGEERRGRYEAAMTALGQRPDMFDRSRPWVPAMSLPILAIQKFGYDPSNGAETLLDAKAKERKIPREGLETIEFQFGLFAGLSEEQQIANLDEVVKGIPEMRGIIESMVTKWSAGDADGLAALLNADSDPVFADLILYSRNRTWTAWISQRMKQPGTVFIAVGAGHLAGDKSVNTMLAGQGYKLSRVQ